VDDDEEEEEEEEEGGEEGGVMSEEEIASSSNDASSVAENGASSGSQGVMMSSDQGKDEVVRPAAKRQVDGFVPGAVAKGLKEETAEGKIHDVRQVIDSRDEDSASTTADEEGTGGKEGGGVAHAATGEGKQRGTSRDRGEGPIPSKSQIHGEEEERGQQDEYASVDDEGEVAVRKYSGVKWDEEGAELKQGVLMQRKREEELGLIAVIFPLLLAALNQRCNTSAPLSKFGADD
jgi:hypothetical protein